MILLNPNLHEVAKAGGFAEPLQILRSISSEDRKVRHSYPNFYSRGFLAEALDTLSDGRLG